MNTAAVTLVVLCADLVHGVDFLDEIHVANWIQAIKQRSIDRLLGIEAKAHHLLETRNNHSV